MRNLSDTYMNRMVAIDEGLDVLDEKMDLVPHMSVEWVKLADERRALSWERTHLCRCGLRVGEDRYDARGIYLMRSCDTCWKQDRLGYRPDVLSDSNYWADEPIDEEY